MTLLMQTQFDAEEEAYGNWVFIKGKDTPDGEKFHKHRKLSWHALGKGQQED